MARYEAKITDYRIAYKFEGERYVRYYDTKEEMFNNACYIYGFSDCEASDIEIQSINCEGDECHYLGWEPGMRMRFENTWGEEVWNKTYPQWEH